MLEIIFADLEYRIINRDRSDGTLASEHKTCRTEEKNQRGSAVLPSGKSTVLSLQSELCILRTTGKDAALSNRPEP